MVNIDFLYWPRSHSDLLPYVLFPQELKRENRSDWWCSSFHLHSHNASCELYPCKFSQKHTVEVCATLQVYVWEAAVVPVSAYSNSKWNERKIICVSQHGKWFYLHYTLFFLRIWEIIVSCYTGYTGWSLFNFYLILFTPQITNSRWPAVNEITLPIPKWTMTNLFFREPPWWYPGVHREDTEIKSCMQRLCVRRMTSLL